MSQMVQDESVQNTLSLYCNSFANITKNTPKKKKKFKQTNKQNSQKSSERWTSVTDESKTFQNVNEYPEATQLSETTKSTSASSVTSGTFKKTTTFTWDISVCVPQVPHHFKLLGHNSAFSVYQKHRRKKKSLVFRRFTSVWKQNKPISASSQMNQTFTDMKLTAENREHTKILQYIPKIAYYLFRQYVKQCAKDKCITIIVNQAQCTAMNTVILTSRYV